MHKGKATTRKHAIHVKDAKRSKYIRRERVSASHGDYRRSLYEVTINSIVKASSRGENTQKPALFAFNACLWLFGFCSGNKKIGGFQVFMASVAYNPAGSRI